MPAPAGGTCPEALDWGPSVGEGAIGDETWKILEVFTVHYVMQSCLIHPLQILLDNVSNPTFDDIKLSNESINKDLVLSPDKMYLYALTNSTVRLHSLTVDLPD